MTERLSMLELNKNVDAPWQTEFLHISRTLMNLNYNVYLEGKVFAFQPKPQVNIFELSDLQAIYSDWKTYKDLKIEGQIKETSFIWSQNVINTCLTASREDRIEPYKTIPSNLLTPLFRDKELLYFFWNSIEMKFKMPPTQVFCHQPSDGSYFNGIFWEFCFIYLHPLSGTGVVLAGAAVD